MKDRVVLCYDPSVWEYPVEMIMRNQKDRHNNEDAWQACILESIKKPTGKTLSINFPVGITNVSKTYQISPILFKKSTADGVIYEQDMNILEVIFLNNQMLLNNMDNDNDT